MTLPGLATEWDDGLVVEQLRVKYRRRAAIDGVNLRLGVGVHGLLGPNGAGKTTLIRVLATVLPPTSGNLTLIGRDTEDRSQLRDIRRRLGYLPQDFGYYPRFTVREFVEYVAWLKEVPAAEIPSAVDDALRQVDMESRADSRMNSLSGGMLRRVGIAQAMVNRPALLLLDEPTAGLDPEQRVEFRNLLRTLGEDTCVLVSTHLVEDVVASCKDLAILREGQFIYSGPVRDMLAAGRSTDAGDSDAERGYSAVLRLDRESR